MRALRKPAMALHSVRSSLLQAADIADDLTTVLLVRHDESRPIYRLEAPVSLGSLEAIRNFVTDHALRAGIPEDVAGPFVVAAVEVMTNIIRHATGRLPEAPVEWFLRHKKEGLVLETSYLGDRFDPPTDSPETNLADFPEGGFGLFIIRNACDRVDYRYSEGVNTVRMTLLNDACAQDSGASIRSSR
jgi:anti-sigma regulatory factor (Ser/Thr protein kinase)